MSADAMLSSPLVHALGWALLHFLWQGALIAGLVTLALSVIRSAHLRYLVCGTGMVLMLVTPLISAAIILLTPGQDPGASMAYRLTTLELASSPLIEGLRSHLPLVVMAWLGGTVAFQLRLLVHWIRARQLRHQLTSPAPAWLAGMVRELTGKLGIPTPVQVFESAAVRVPSVIGWLSPVILVPVGVLTSLTSDQLRAILAHELAHVRRHDFLVNVLQSVLETLLFYHPAVWWLSHRLRVEREYCCDDVAIATCGDTLCYARALASLDAFRDRHPVLASTGGPLMKRIARIVGVNARPGRPASPLLTGVSTTLAALAVGLVAAGCFESTTDVAGDTGSDAVSTKSENVELAGSATFTFDAQQNAVRFGPDDEKDIHLDHLDGTEGIRRQPEGNVFFMDPEAGTLEGYVSPDQVAEFKRQVDKALRSGEELDREDRVLLEELTSGQSTLLRLHPTPPSEHLEQRSEAELKKIQAYMEQRGLTEMRVGDQVIELQKTESAR